jgi:hypothetical protein
MTQSQSVTQGSTRGSIFSRAKIDRRVKHGDDAGEWVNMTGTRCSGEPRIVMAQAARIPRTAPGLTEGLFAVAMPIRAIDVNCGTTVTGLQTSSRGRSWSPSQNVHRLVAALSAA